MIPRCTYRENLVTKIEQCIIIFKNQYLPMTWILIKSGLPCPTSFLATQEILASVSKVTGSMVQLNVLTSWTIWPPLFQIYSVASGRPGSSTLQVNVMAWPLTTISVSLLIKACPGGSARPKYILWEWTLRPWMRWAIRKAAKWHWLWIFMPRHTKLELEINVFFYEIILLCPFNHHLSKMLCNNYQIRQSKKKQTHDPFDCFQL